MTDTPQEQSPRHPDETDEQYAQRLRQESDVQSDTDNED